MAAYQKPTTDWRYLERRQEQKMQPCCLMRVPGLIAGIQFIYSSRAWSKFADIQWLQKNSVLSFIPFLLFILIVLIFPSKDWKKKSFSICSSRKKTLQVHTYLLKTAFFTVLMSQLSVSQMIHFKDTLTRKAEQILFAEGKKTILIEMLNFSRVTLYTFTVGFQPLPGQQILLQGNI